MCIIIDSYVGCSIKLGLLVDDRYVRPVRMCDNLRKVQLER